MADCSELFLRFNEAITLTPTDRKFLRAARASITKKIRTYFSENKQCPKVDFIGQGSFTMGTIVKPLPDGEYDIDIGVYLRGLSDYRNDWPKTETVSQWLLKALESHTSIPPVNKRRCVRIIYKPKSRSKNVSYHVDLPIYCEYINFWGNKKTRIGITGDLQWEQKSDPVGFTKYFIEGCQQNTKDKDQLVRLVKYIKAWKEYNQQDSKFPSGMSLTIMMTRNYFQSSRDDLAFRETIRRAYNNMFGLFGSSKMPSPVEPFNDINERLTPRQMERFRGQFEKLVDDGKKAVDCADRSHAIAIWKKHFDERMLPP